MTPVISGASQTSGPTQKDDWRGGDYAKNAQLQYQLGLSVINSHPIDQGKIFLDVGSGDGYLTNYIAKRFLKCEKVVGIDTSESMIEAAKKQPLDQRVSIQKKNITDPGITSLGLFDTVFSFNTLHWIRDQQTALENIYKLLEFGGTFRAQLFPPLAANQHFIGSLDKLRQEDKWNRFLKDFKLDQMEIETIKEYESLLKKVGFKNVEAIEHSFPLTKTRTEIANSLKSWLPHLRVIPENFQDAFLRELVAHLFEAEGFKDLDIGTLKAPYWTILAQK